MAAVDFLYYCSLQDVKDRLINYSTHFGSGNNLSDKVLRRFISQAYGKLNAALNRGGYNVPVTNSTQTTLSGDESLSATPVEIGVADETGFSAGDTVRLHGADSATAPTTAPTDEFTGIIATGASKVFVEFLENAHKTDATLELCTEGYLFLRDCNADGAAYLAASGVALKDTETSSNLDRLEERFENCLEQLREGQVSLEGLSVSESYIETWQTNNSDEDDADSLFERDYEF